MIVGGGIVGLTLACALAQETDLSIVILESSPVNPTGQDLLPAEYHPRVSAITLTSRRIFEHLSVWPSIEAKRVSPFKQIQVWDRTFNAEINFDAHHIDEDYLGFIVENQLIQSALLEKIHQFPQIQWVAPVTLQDSQITDRGIELKLTNQQTFSARIAVAADGVRSWLREQSGIQTNRHDYQQTAIVTNVKTSMPHDKTARQVFLKEGPLAFLPLADPYHCSIVWSLPTENAKTAMNLDEDTFKKQLAEAFDHRLGEVLTLSQRYSFPLVKQSVKNYVKGPIVLMGDAAHTIHPLAGQGVNMGLLDATSFAEIIIEARKKNRDFAARDTLRRYERWRKADNVWLLEGLDVIKFMFGSDQPFIKEICNVGVNWLNRTEWLKNIFTMHAVGLHTKHQYSHISV